MRLLANPFVPVGCQKAAHDIILLAIVSNGAIMYSTNTWIAIFQKSSNLNLLVHRKWDGKQLFRDQLLCTYTSQCSYVSVRYEQKIYAIIVFR